eukprot:TRINITY_DN3526_c0_g1_i7.p1 TRINITY_DN3526_c0_g1~~TRINITY_DN3526_c0_g1_i7.p1  ORF type:complete len:709 (-),score=179.89 TRINITY_DN3526_c0_g1_i7:122-2248(-)
MSDLAFIVNAVSGHIHDGGLALPFPFHPSSAPLRYETRASASPMSSPLLYSPSMLPPIPPPSPSFQPLIHYSVPGADVGHNVPSMYSIYPPLHVGMFGLQSFNTPQQHQQQPLTRIDLAHSTGNLDVSSYLIPMPAPQPQGGAHYPQHPQPPSPYHSSSSSSTHQFHNVVQTTTPPVATKFISAKKKDILTRIEEVDTPLAKALLRLSRARDDAYTQRPSYEESFLPDHEDGVTASLRPLYEILEHLPVSELRQQYKLLGMAQYGSHNTLLKRINEEFDLGINLPEKSPRVHIMKQLRKNNLHTALDARRSSLPGDAPLGGLAGHPRGKTRSLDIDPSSCISSRPCSRRRLSFEGMPQEHPPLFVAEDSRGSGQNEEAGAGIPFPFSDLGTHKHAMARPLGAHGTRIATPGAEEHQMGSLGSDDDDDDMPPNGVGLFDMGQVPLSLLPFPDALPRDFASLMTILPEDLLPPSGTLDASSLDSDEEVGPTPYAPPTTTTTTTTTTRRAERTIHAPATTVPTSSIDEVYVVRIAKTFSQRLPSIYLASSTDSMPLPRHKNMHAKDMTEPRCLAMENQLGSCDLTDPALVKSEALRKHKKQVPTLDVRFPFEGEGVYERVRLLSMDELRYFTHVLASRAESYTGTQICTMTAMCAEDIAHLTPDVFWSCVYHMGPLSSRFQIWPGMVPQFGEDDDDDDRQVPAVTSSSDVY